MTVGAGVVGLGVVGAGVVGAGVVGAGEPGTTVVAGAGAVTVTVGWGVVSLPQAATDRAPTTVNPINARLTLFNLLLLFIGWELVFVFSDGLGVALEPAPCLDSTGNAVLAFVD